MRVIRRISAAAVAALLLSLCACGGKKQAANYTLPGTMETAASGEVARNERFSLRWDAEKNCVLFADTATGQIFGTTPYAYYQTDGDNYSLSSPLVIEYYDRYDGSIQTAKAKDCADEGTVSAAAENGTLRVTYYFDAAGIAVTVEYSLREDSLQLRLRTDDIRETGRTELISVSLAPYLCSAANRADRSAYLVLPVGSGALMYTDEDASGVARTFSGMVYGSDPACTALTDPAEETAIRLPFFGMKDGNAALCAVIESGEGAVRVDATAGNSRNGYSAVYPTVFVRGYNNAEWENKDALLLTEQPVSGLDCVIGYYPLTDGEASYTGMAACYRRFLEKNGRLKKSGQALLPYQVTLIGGVRVKSFTLGIPHNTVQAVTTFAGAETILKELTADTGLTPTVLLKGFGSSGISAGKIGGGLTFAGVLGGEKGHRRLEAYCQAQNIPLYTDFELIRFTETGTGVSPLLHAALTADGQSVGRYPLRFNVRTENTDAVRVRFAARDRLPALAQKIAAFCRGRVSGTALSSFGQTAYSDYRQDVYALKNGLAAQAEQVTETLRTEHPLLLEAANAYAAGLADVLTKVPLENGGYDALDETVPLYAAVFGGSIPLYSDAVNLAADPVALLLSCAEAGVSPGFVLGDSADEALLEADEPLYCGILFDGQREAVAKAAAGTAELMSRIAGSGIESHDILQTGVTRTVFRNGTTVLVNRTASAVTADGVTVEAYSFVY